MRVFFERMLFLVFQFYSRVKMKAICMCVVILVCVGQSTADTDDLQFLPKGSESDSEMFVQKAWDAFKTQFTKKYSGMEEEQRRKLIFIDSLKTIEEHNYRYKMGLTTYDMGINQFSDMEFSEVMEANGYMEFNDTVYDNVEYDEESVSSSDDEAIPKYVDWRDRGYVTRVKNQGSCGSCWAFSATGSLEGQTRRKTGRLVSLSEQNLVDCSFPQGNKGCKGGLSIWAFDYIRKNRGIDTEAAYPYTGKEGKCNYKSLYRGATVRGYVRLQSGSEKTLTKALSKVGPISVSMDVRNSFQHYKSGIYSDPFCDRSKSNHALVAVGYGTYNGKRHYIVKNSWGTTWGTGGYVYVARGGCNMCGIATKAVYPRV